MGTISFQLPRTASPPTREDLGRACMAGGYDNMPAPTHVHVDPDQIRLVREVDESGYLLVPWEVNGAGRLMGSSATLVERGPPYRLSVELARGKINQLRCQAAEWRMVGLQIPEILDNQIRETSQLFGRAATTGGPAADADALQALDEGYKSANQLVRVYVDQIYRARHQRQPKLDTTLGVRLNGLPPPAASDAIARACNSASIPLMWKQIEPAESQYSWSQADAMLDWTAKRNVRPTAGPLVDFSTYGLPDWLWLWEGDLPSLSSFMCDYVETVVGRYHKRIRRWQLTAASNNSRILKLGEDDLLWLTARLAEAAWQVDPELELSVGVSEPWGEYMAREDHTYSPFVFADTLIRAGLKLAALDIEFVMGVTPRGSYCRDLLEASRVLDLYAMLGVPIEVTLGYPSASKADPLADPAIKVSGGFWESGFTPEVQANWVADFASLAACKPFVRALSWVDLSDAESHQFPHAGLLDAAGKPKPGLDDFRHLRETHLR